MAFVALNEAPAQFHHMMKFLSECKVSKTLLEALTIICNMMEIFWQSAEVSDDFSNVTLMCKGIEYKLTSLILRECLELSCNNCDAMPDKIEIRDMLKSINYVDPNVNLGKIVR